MMAVHPLDGEQEDSGLSMSHALGDSFNDGRHDRGRSLW